MTEQPTPFPVRGGTAIQSVDRALAIMEILGRDGWAGVTDMAAELNIHKSTVFRLLATLEGRAMVEQHPGTQKYRLGFAVVRLASGVRAGLDLKQIVRPILERLSELAEETVNLAVLEGAEVVNIDQANLSNSVVSVDWLGRRSPPHVTATGKVFLAHAPPRMREDYLSVELPAATPHSITSRSRLEAQLDEVRLRGYAVALGELEEGLHAVAAGVRGADGSVIAAVSLSGPSYRIPLERIPQVGQLVRESADEVSRKLGFAPTVSEVEGSA